jgi:hypothetical protein
MILAWKNYVVRIVDHLLFEFLFHGYCNDLINSMDLLKLFMKPCDAYLKLVWNEQNFSETNSKHKWNNATFVESRWNLYETCEANMHVYENLYETLLEINKTIIKPI